MHDRLDQYLSQLAADPAEGALGGLERDVWARVDEAARWSPAASVRVRLASVGLALAAGAVIGGVSAAAATHGPPAEMAVFSAEPQIAPSTLFGVTS